MNLGSGYLVYRRYRSILKNMSSRSMKQQLETKCPSYDLGTFLFIYCIPCALLLFSVIYEFANIDIWLNIPPYLVASKGFTTPMWPFLTKAFMEITLGIICFAWFLGPRISAIYKQQLQMYNTKEASLPTITQRSSRNANHNYSYSTASYQTIRPAINPYSQQLSPGSVSMNKLTKYSHKKAQGIHNPKNIQKTRYYVRPAQMHFECGGDETIL